MVEITKRTSFRSSKSSFREIIDGRELFFTATKKDKGVISVYDILTGVLICCSAKSMDFTKQWLLDHTAELKTRIAKYETKQERSLFS